MKIVRLIVNAICQIANFSNNYVDVDDIKIEEKMGNISETELINGIVIDKTIDNSSMPHIVENARVLLLDIDIENEQTKADAQISISVPNDLGRFLEYGTNEYTSKDSKRGRLRSECYFFTRRYQSTGPELLCKEKHNDSAKSQGK